MSTGPRDRTGGRAESGTTGGPGQRSAAARPSPVAAGTDDGQPSGAIGASARRYAETLVAEHAAAAAARERSAAAGGAPGRPGAAPPEPVLGGTPGTATTLTFLAATVGARSAVEVGTGAGVSGLALLAGMPTGSVLTSVDIEGAYQRLARATMTEAEIAPTRARLINGRALDVLPRLTDGAYDVVFADADPSENLDYLTEALRLLRPGGILAFNNALDGDGLSDPARRDVAAQSTRALHTAVLDDDRLSTVLLPVGSGLLVATVLTA